jgi:hypothetical protein
VRLDTVKMLDDTKIKSTNILKMLAECTEKNNVNLADARNTIVNLDIKQGLNFYMGNISYRSRFRKAAPDEYFIFI